MELGGTPRPLNGKNPLSSILQVPFKHKYEFVFRLCSFPSPNYFIKPCDMHDTIKPFCYTRLNEVFSLISNHFAGSDVKTNIAGRLVLWWWQPELGILWGEIQSQGHSKTHIWSRLRLWLEVKVILSNNLMNLQRRCQGEQSSPESPYNLGNHDEVSSDFSFQPRVYDKVSANVATSRPRCAKKSGGSLDALRGSLIIRN